MSNRTDNIRLVHPLFHEGGDGSTPTSALYLLFCALVLVILLSISCVVLWDRVQSLEEDLKVLKDRRWIQVPRKWNRIIVEVPKSGNAWDGFDLPKGSEVYVADETEMVLVLPSREGGE